MATWDELVSYVRVRYEIMKQREGELWFDLLTTGERHQRVAVRQVTGEDGHPFDARMGLQRALGGEVGDRRREVEEEGRSAIRG